MSSEGNASPEQFQAAEEPSQADGVSLWRLLRGYRADPLERWGTIRARHGEVAKYRFGWSDTYLVSSPEGVRRVLQDNAANYSKRHGSYEMIRRVFGDGLLTSEGSFWLRQRRLAQPAFHRQRIAAMAAQMATSAEEAAARWEALASSGERVSLLAEMSRLTLKIAGDALFGTGLAAQSAAVARAWDVLNTQLVERFSRKRLIPPVLPTAYDRAFREARRTLFRVVDEIIADKRKRESDDLLSMLIQARDEDTGAQMNDAQLRDEVVTLLLAGHDTTATALAWTWTLLDQHPAARARLREELDAALGGRTPAGEDLPRLPYTRAVLDEAMRLRPPVYLLNRRVEGDDVVCGRRVRRGASVVIPLVLLHRLPEHWERPDAFVPERWLDAEAEKRRPKFLYLPFSGGPRQCIGNQFSMMESALILATLAQRFDVALEPGYEPRPEYLVLARPSEGVPARIARRAAAEASLRHAG